MRSKSVDFNSWLELQMWRSDGAPAAHGTFALVAINLKLKRDCCNRDTTLSIFLESMCQPRRRRFFRRGTKMFYKNK